MSDLVRNPEDWFAHVAAHIKDRKSNGGNLGLVFEKTCRGDSTDRNSNQRTLIVWFKVKIAMSIEMFM